MGLYRHTSELLPERRGGGGGGDGSGGGGGGGGGVPRRGRRFGGRITKQRLSRWVFALALIFMVYLIVSCVRMFFFGEFLGLRSFVFAMCILFVCINVLCVTCCLGNVEDKRVLILRGVEEDGVLGSNSERPPPKSNRRKKCKNCWLCMVFLLVLLGSMSLILCV